MIRLFPISEKYLTNISLHQVIKAIVDSNTNILQGRKHPRENLKTSPKVLLKFLHSATLPPITIVLYYKSLDFIEPQKNTYFKALLRVSMLCSIPYLSVIL